MKKIIVQDVRMRETTPGQEDCHVDCDNRPRCGKCLVVINSIEIGINLASPWYLRKKILEPIGQMLLDRIELLQPKFECQVGVTSGTFILPN